MQVVTREHASRTTHRLKEGGVVGCVLKDRMEEKQVWGTKQQSQKMGCSVSDVSWSCSCEQLIVDDFLFCIPKIVQQIDPDDQADY
jgi:hypothetical protein